MKVAAVIPARMGSSRFPGKPLAKIAGMPMIRHVYERARLSRALAAVYVATCDAEIRRAVESFGGRVIMTSPKHERGTDRIAEAARKIEADVVVNIQGDEPLLRPEMVDLAVRPLKRERGLGCVNLMAELRDEDEVRDRNEIKVVSDRRGFALYMSREPIPTRVRLGRDAAMFKQVCVIPFRRELLFRFARLAPTPLEKAESIDMLRLMEHGIPVRMVLSPYETYSVDTPQDLKFVENIMRKDPLRRRYRASAGQ